MPGIAGSGIFRIFSLLAAVNRGVPIQLPDSNRPLSLADKFVQVTGNALIFLVAQTVHQGSEREPEILQGSEVF